MFGCCQKAMAAIYINESGEVSQDYLDSNYPEGSKVVEITDTTSDVAKFVYSRKNAYPIHKKVKDPSGNLHEICLCGCHQLGLAVMC